MRIEDIKAGDKVRVVNSCSNPDMPIGSVHTVRKVSEHSVWVFPEGHGNDGWLPCRFELVKKAPQKSVPGSYATGKGTTARILNFLQGRPVGRQVSVIATALKVPSRQLHKRLAEQVKKGNIRKTETDRYTLVPATGAAEFHPDFPAGCAG